MVLTNTVFSTQRSLKLINNSETDCKDIDKKDN